MNYLRTYRAKPASISLLCLLVVSTTSGCKGGVIGTGTGPAVDTYQLEHLPKRISPEIPKSLLKGEEIELAPVENQDSHEDSIKHSPYWKNIESVKSNGWLRMNDELILASLARVNAELNSTIIDIAFDDIRARCANQLMDCTIPDNQIKVKLTPIVIERMIGLVTDLAQGLPAQFLNDEQNRDRVNLINEQFTSLLGSEVVLGETHYSQLDGGIYDHTVRTFLKRKAVSSEEFTVLLWKNEEFSASWKNDGNIAKFMTMADNYSNIEYFYQNNLPSEIVVVSFLTADSNDPTFTDFHVKLIGNDSDNAGVLVEVAQVSTVPLTIDGESSLNFNHGLFQGRMDNDGGYTTFDRTTFNFSDTIKTVSYAGLRDSFDSIGNLIAGKECSEADFNQGIEGCDEENFVPTGPIGNSIVDSPYYFNSEQFDSLTAVQDVIQWTVEELPAEIKRIAIISADSTINLSERKLLCRGFTFHRNETRIYCNATDEQLVNTIVSELVDGKPVRVIPTAKLVQIQ